MPRHAKMCLGASADSEGPDQTTGLCYPLTELFDTIVCMIGEQMPG